MRDRSNYKGTWDALARSPTQAKLAVAGHADEVQLDESGRLTMEMIDRLLSVDPADVVLEIGCGVGRVGKSMSPRCAKWIGTDISRGMLDVAALRLRALKNIELVELSGIGLREIPDESVTLVYCTVVFLHLYEWDRFRYIEEAFRVLKPGGRCFFDGIDVASTRGWQVFMDGCALAPDQRPSHLSMISTGDELRTYGVKAGFNEVVVHRWEDTWVGITGLK